MQRSKIDRTVKKWTHNLLDDTERYATLMEYYALNHSGSDVKELQQDVLKVYIRFLMKRGIVVKNAEFDSGSGLSD